MSKRPLVVACVQVNPGDDAALNVLLTLDAIRKAAHNGASLVVTPEYTTFLHASGKAMRESAFPEHRHPSLPQFTDVARELGIWLVVGSLVLAEGDGKLLNRSFVISDTGNIVARYDKIHMFDATLPNGRVIRESSAYDGGAQAVVVDSPWGRLGLSICYDLRFPGLYRSLAQAGAEILLVPSAFTKPTGALHWHALLQARAVENGAYVIAPATCGSHPGGHETYGHSLIVDPNGQVLATAGDTPDVICASIDSDAVTSARARIPSLLHDRPFRLTIAGQQTYPIQEEQHEPL